MKSSGKSLSLSVLAGVLLTAGSVGIVKLLGISTVWAILPVLFAVIMIDSMRPRETPEVWDLNGSSTTDDLAAGLRSLPPGTKVVGSIRFPNRILIETKDGRFVPKGTEA